MKGPKGDMVPALRAPVRMHTLVPALVAGFVAAGASFHQAGCSSCSGARAGNAGAEPGKAVLIPPGGAKQLEVIKSKPAVVPEALITGRSGTVEVARSELSLASPSIMDQPDALFIGDSVSTGADGYTTLDLGSDVALALGPSSRLSIGKFRPREVVLHIGTATLSGAAINGLTQRIPVMTPAGIVFHAGPSTGIAVAADGAVRVDVVDCPLKDTSGVSKKLPPGGNVPVERCSMLVGTQEQWLVTGDRVEIDASLAPSVTRMQGGGADPAGWLEERAGKIEEHRKTGAAVFASWVSPTVAEIRTIVTDIQASSERNKELIKKLRDLRQAGKPDSSADISASAGATAAAGVGEIQQVKNELGDNSALQYRLRHVLLARWYQLALRFQLLQALLTDDILAPSGYSAAGMEGLLDGIEVDISGLLSRKPQSRLPGKMLTLPRLDHGPIKSISPVGPKK